MIVVAAELTRLVAVARVGLRGAAGRGLRDRRRRRGLGRRSRQLGGRRGGVGRWRRGRSWRRGLLRRPDRGRSPGWFCRALGWRGADVRGGHAGSRRSARSWPRFRRCFGGDRQRNHPDDKQHSKDDTGGNVGAPDRFGHAEVTREQAIWMTGKKKSPPPRGDGEIKPGQATWDAGREPCCASGPPRSCDPCCSCPPRAAEAAPGGRRSCPSAGSTGWRGPSCRRSCRRS